MFGDMVDTFLLCNGEVEHALDGDVSDGSAA